MSEHDTEQRQARTSAVEWIVAGASGLLILFVIAYLSYDAVARPSTPPDVVVTVDSTARLTRNFVAYFSARNGGSATAAAVRLTAELRAPNDSVLERSTVVVNFIPAASTQRGGFYFSRDPRGLRVAARAEGYTRP